MPLHWFLFGLACAAALPAAFTLDPVLDTDTWWHMATGRWIVENGNVPWIDPFGYHAEPTRWYAYSWLYDIVVFELFHNCSYTGIIVYRTILVATSTLTVMLFLVRRSGVSHQTVIVALLTGMVLMMFAKERPWHFTIVFTTLTLWAMQSIRETGNIRRTLWLLPLFVLWANLHIQFTHGYIVLIAGLLFPGEADRRKVLLLSLACLCATVLNPYHLRLAEVIFEYAMQSAPRELVQELVPPSIASPSTWATILLGCYAAWQLIAAKQLEHFQIALLAISIVAASLMRREIWFVAVVAISSLNAHRTPVRNEVLLRSCSWTVIAVFTVIRAFNFLGIGPPPDFESRNRDRYPITECERIHLSLGRYAGSVLNEFDDGGYLIWSLPSWMNVTLDGRTNLYGDERLRQSFKLLETGEAWSWQWNGEPRLAILKNNRLPPSRHPQSGLEWFVISKTNNHTMYIGIKWR